MLLIGRKPGEFHGWIGNGQHVRPRLDGTIAAGFLFITAADAWVRKAKGFRNDADAWVFPNLQLVLSCGPTAIALQGGEACLSVHSGWR